MSVDRFIISRLVWFVFNFLQQFEMHFIAFWFFPREKKIIYHVMRRYRDLFICQQHFPGIFSVEIALPAALNQFSLCAVVKFVLSINLNGFSCSSSFDVILTFIFCKQRPLSSLCMHRCIQLTLLTIINGSNSKIKWNKKWKKHERSFDKQTSGHFTPFCSELTGSKRTRMTAENFSNQISFDILWPVVFLFVVIWFSQFSCIHSINCAFSRLLSVPLRYSLLRQVLVKRGKMMN